MIRWSASGGFAFGLIEVFKISRSDDNMITAASAVIMSVPVRVCPWLIQNHFVIHSGYQKQSFASPDSDNPYFAFIPPINNSKRRPD